MPKTVLDEINHALSKLESLFKTYSLTLPTDSQLLQFPTKGKLFDLGDPQTDKNKYENNILLAIYGAIKLLKKFFSDQELSEDEIGSLKRILKNFGMFTKHPMETPMIVGEKSYKTVAIAGRLFDILSTELLSDELAEKGVRGLPNLGTLIKLATKVIKDEDLKSGIKGSMKYLRDIFLKELKKDNKKHFNSEIEWSIGTESSQIGTNLGRALIFVSNLTNPDTSAYIKSTPPLSLEILQDQKIEESKKFLIQ